MWALLEWSSAIAIGLSIIWYPSQSGWKRKAAPSVGILGGAGFALIAGLGGLWGIAGLNAAMIFVNSWNLYKAVNRRESDRPVR